VHVYCRDSDLVAKKAVGGDIGGIKGKSAVIE
jgi:hypothetical protein